LRAGARIPQISNAIPALTGCFDAFFVRHVT
jgi:hypothetical protein